MSRYSFHAFVLAALGLTVSCAPAPQRTYVAPSPATIFTETQEGAGDKPSHTIFVVNQSTVPVTVFSVTLRGCQNVKQRCEPKPVKVPVAPGRRTVVMRVEPANENAAFQYNFTFSWHADSSSAAATAAALAASGDPAAAAKVAAMQRDDSIRRLDMRLPYKELTRDDFGMLRARVASLRPVPDSVVMSPGQQSSIQRVRLLVLDPEGRILGWTRWVRWSPPIQGTVQFVPPDRLIARSPGRDFVRFSLADEAQGLLANQIVDVELPVVVTSSFDPHAPVFKGMVVDADTKSPLKCARIALEDSASNVVSRDRTDAGGAFVLRAPGAGTYRMRVETHGWAPAYGPTEVAVLDEEKQREYAVRFTEQVLVPRYEFEPRDYQRARPAAVRTGPVSMGAGAKNTTRPIVDAVTLGGSESMPILGIVSRLPALTTWAQFTVDERGQVDTTSISLPPGTTPGARATVVAVLPRVRFSPAREAGKATCELVRLQVNFSPR